MAKADVALQSARVLFREGDNEGACSRAYYAIFNAANAALQASGFDPSVIKTHSGLMTVFGQKLVLSGVVDVRQSKAIAEVQFLRQLADYSDNPPDPVNTAAAIEKAEAFLATMRHAFPALD